MVVAEAQAVIRYLLDVRSALGDLPARERDAAIAELEENLHADIERRGGDSDAVAAALADLGTPAEYAAAVREAFGADSDAVKPQGRILGMPYEFRALTADRVMDRMWNPADPRIFMPRLFGVGWTINFGAVAVRLGLARPDDVEERPFGNLGRAAENAAMSVPLALGAATAAIAALFWSRLPETVPTHFDGAGVADGWGPKTLAIGIPVAIAFLAPVVVLAWQKIARASRGTVVILSTLLSLFSALGLAIVGYTVANAVYGVTGWWVAVLTLGTLAVPGIMFYLLARASLKKEWDAARSASGREKGSR